VKTDTSTLILNAAELDISSASVYSEALQQEQVNSSPTLDASLERVTLNLAQALPAGSKAQLKIPFKAKLTGSMMGYYKSSWDDGGKRKTYTLTQFEVGDVQSTISRH
jgi:aminopeptidase 2